MVLGLLIESIPLNQNKSIQLQKININLFLKSSAKNDKTFILLVQSLAVKVFLNLLNYDSRCSHNGELETEAFFSSIPLNAFFSN